MGTMYFVTADKLLGNRTRNTRRTRLHGEAGLGPYGSRSPQSLQDMRGSIQNPASARPPGEWDDIALYMVVTEKGADWANIGWETIG